MSFNFKQFFTEYITKPLVIWAIFFTVIIRLTFIPEIFNFVEWILVSQIYLPIFLSSFVFTYLQQMIPIYKAMNMIKEKQSKNKWTVPRIMSNRFGMNITLWLSGALFFSAIWLSFGTLYDESITNKEKFTQLQILIPMVGFVLLPAISVFYSIDSYFFLKKNGIKLHEKPDLEVILPIVFMIFFVALSYTAIICFNII